MTSLHTLIRMTLDLRYCQSIPTGQAEAFPLVIPTWKNAIIKHGRE